MKSPLFAFLIILTAAPTVFAAQPIDVWLFDEASGDIAYNAINGRSNGYLTPLASFVPGVAGNAVYLPPYESVDFDAGNFGTSDFTVRFWMKTLGDGIGNDYSSYAELLGNRGGYGSCGSYFDLRMRRDGSMQFVVMGDESCNGYGETETDEAAGVVNDGNWHLVTALRSGPTFSLYIDGAQRASGSSFDGTTANIVSPYLMAAGANENTWTYEVPFNGLIDGLELFDRALSAFEMATPAQKLAIIKATLTSYGLSSGIDTALNTKLDAALADLGTGDVTAAKNVINAFINQCNAQSGKKLTGAQSAELIAFANATIAAIN